MTDYSKMTDEQVNEAILSRKGYVRCEKITTDFAVWVNRDGDEIYYLPPNYTHDWRLAGELLEEMMLNNQVSFWKETGGYSCELSCFEDYFTAPTHQRAICEAWLAWKEQG